VINAGLYIIEPEVLELVPKGEKFDFSKQLFPLLLEMEWPIYAKKIDGVWFDVGVPDELIRAQKVLIEQMDNLPFPMPDGIITEGNGFEFSSSNSMGDNNGSLLSNNVKVGENTLLSNSLIMANSTIGENCQVMESVLGCNVIIEDNCIIKKCIIGDGAIISKGSILDSKKMQ
jgi:NDP-sugar pyrophosphorylase family protein